MPHLVVASFLSLVFATAAYAQAKPDFTGTWQMDSSRSESAIQGEPIGPVTVVITQTATDIRVDTTTRRGTTSQVYQFAVGDKAPAAGTAIARWRDETLLFDVVREVRGQSVTMQQSRYLSTDGNEMIVESVVNVQHGYTLSGAKTYGAGKDVFVKARR
jgi:hypothetical protein